MNTRRYPRTLNEAFPRTAEYGCAIERTTRFNYGLNARVIMVVLVCLVLMAVTS